MPPIFPTPGPEELLYSAIARHGDMMGYESLRVRWQSVYGRCVPRPEVDLCGPLGSFLARMPPGHRYTAQNLIRRHTLVPYLTFSMAPSRREAVEAMLSGSGARPTGSPLGIGRWSVKPPAYLRYCSACAEEDIRGSVGAPYWRRVHQLPGVLVCPHHDRPLVMSSIGRGVHAEPRNFVSLKRALALGKNAALEVPEPYLRLCSDVARDSLWLLQNADAGDGRLPERHRAWHLALGWKHTQPRLAGAFSYSVFVGAFQAYYEEDFLRLICEGRDALLMPASGGWLRQMTLPSCAGQAFHPLQHILMWRFLGLSADAFFGDFPEHMLQTEPSEEVEQQTLEGPCPNPVCPEYDPPVPRVLEASSSAASGRVTISCPRCEFTYTQRPECSERQRIRIKKTGALWDAKLRQLMKTDVSLHEMARQLGFARAVVQRHVLRLGLWREAWAEGAQARADADAQKERRDHRIRERNRQKWLQAQKDFPGASRSELRQVAARTGSYLVQHDKEWYELHSPAEQPAFGNRQAQDWQQLDAKTLQAARRIVDQMKGQPEPVRITLSAIARRVGQANTLTYRLRHMPKTEAFIAGVVETHEQFATRRLRSSIRRFSEENVMPTKTMFCSASHLNNASFRGLVEEAFETLRVHLEEGGPLPEKWLI